MHLAISCVGFETHNIKVLSSTMSCPWFLIIKEPHRDGSSSAIRRNVNSRRTYSSMDLFHSMIHYCLALHDKEVVFHFTSTNRIGIYLFPKHIGWHTDMWSLSSWRSRWNVGGLCQPLCGNKKPPK